MRSWVTQPACEANLRKTQEPWTEARRDSVLSAPALSLVDAQSNNSKWRSRHGAGHCAVSREALVNYQVDGGSELRTAHCLEQCASEAHSISTPQPQRRSLRTRCDVGAK